MEGKTIEIIKNNQTIIDERLYDTLNGKYHSGKPANIGDEGFIAFGVVKENPEDIHHPWVQLIYLSEGEFPNYELVPNVKQGNVLPVIQLKN